MQFRLTYEGALFGASRTDTRAKHKHDIRRVFHPQIKRLWEITNHLLPDEQPIPTGPGFLVNSEPVSPPRIPRWKVLADLYRHGGYRFVPLVTRDLSLLCALEILFLRPSHPGAVIKSGDIDNRLKTVFDALRMPKEGEIGSCGSPAENEDPFYCLLEDDELINRVSVETDSLLQPTAANVGNNDSRLVITVTIRPSQVIIKNIGFM